MEGRSIFGDPTGNPQPGVDAELVEADYSWLVPQVKDLAGEPTLSLTRNVTGYNMVTPPGIEPGLTA